MKPSKVRHVAFVSREAFWFSDLDPMAPGLRAFVRIPRGYAHGFFTVQWVNSSGRDFAMIRFEIWKKKRRLKP